MIREDYTINREEPEDEQHDELLRMLLEKLGECRAQLRDWHEKLKRLRHRVAKVPIGSQFKSEFEEASAATLLVALQLKSHVVCSLAIQSAPSFIDQFRSLAFRQFLRDNEIGIRDALFDRHCVGLGVLQLAREGEELKLRHVAPEDILIDTRYGFREPHYVFRRVRLEDSELFEYYDPIRHILFAEGKILSAEPNLLEDTPIYLIPGIHAGGNLFPISDAELALPQQQLIDEIRRTLLNSARRSQPIMEYRVGDIEEAELSALESGERLIIGTASGQSLRPVQVPFASSEWSALEQLARQDMDTLLGISDVLRSSLTDISGSMTATQAIAEAALVNARLAADLIEVRAAILRLAEHWHLLQFGEPAQFVPVPEQQPQVVPVPQAQEGGDTQ